MASSQPIDVHHPLQEQNNLLVNLGTRALLGIGPDSDIVAFSYSCAHMGCPLHSMYKSEHKVLGLCAWHCSQFDLTKGEHLSIGQATHNLPQVLLEVGGSGVFATGVTGILYGHWNNLASGTGIAQN